MKQAVSHWELGRNECSVTQFLRIAHITKMNPAELDEWPADLRVLTGAAENDEGANMNGWPLSVELLAALQNSDSEALRRAENSARAALGLDGLPRGMSETTGSAA